MFDLSDPVTRATVLEIRRQAIAEAVKIVLEYQGLEPVAQRIAKLGETA